MLHPAALEETALLEQCEVRRQRRSGPGGQHRNKVETAVVITHLPTGVRGEASERRSQEQNRRRALARLRMNLALQIRQPRELGDYTPSVEWTSSCKGGKLSIGAESWHFATRMAELLDLLAACEFELKDAAARLNCSSSQLIKFLQAEPKAFAFVNEQRRARGRHVYHG